MTTKVSHSRWAARSSARSAASKAKKIRLRISSASSMVFRPGATAAHSGWPKYECVAPVARMSWSYGIASLSRRSTRRPGTSTARASARRTVAFAWWRRMRRMGAAMSAGLSPAVATW